MQRAAASTPVTEASTPEQSSNKRRRLSDPNVTPQSPAADLQRMQAAVAEEEAKRQLALERQGAEAGETKWKLSFQDDPRGEGSGAHRGLRVVRAGYASIDHSPGKSYDRSHQDDEAWRPPTVGRKIFGHFKSASAVSVWHTFPLDHVLATDERNIAVPATRQRW